jgi:hypothetical protein
VDEWPKRERHPSRAEFAVVIRGGHQGFIETSVAAIKSSLLLGSTPAAIVQTLLPYNLRVVFRSPHRYSRSLPAAVVVQMVAILNTINLGRDCDWRVS